MMSSSSGRPPTSTLLCVFGFVGMLATVPAHAEIYPARPIRIIAPTAPGGPVDVLARLTGDRLARALGQPVVIENRPGAGSIVGSKAVAGAPPDGYTLLFGASSSLAVTPALYKNAGYDPVKSFTPVASVSQGALVLAVTPSLPVKSVADLVAYAKANPGKLNYGSATRLMSRGACSSCRPPPTSSMCRIRMRCRRSPTSSPGVCT
jgi:tripartite-type tricarboxylate transporter receptor subunit TctC